MEPRLARRLKLLEQRKIRKIEGDYIEKQGERLGFEEGDLMYLHFRDFLKVLFGWKRVLVFRIHCILVFF